MSSRHWSTTVELTGGGEATETENLYEVGVFSTIYKTYYMRDVKTILDRLRKEELLRGKPKRKMDPLTRYILEELIHQYFKIYAPRGAVLQKIIVEDSKSYGI